jgi:hypothetical protein
LGGLVNSVFNFLKSLASLRFAKQDFTCESHGLIDRLSERLFMNAASRKPVTHQQADLHANPPSGSGRSSGSGGGSSSSSAHQLQQ